MVQKRVSEWCTKYSMALSVYRLDSQTQKKVKSLFLQFVKSDCSLFAFSHHYFYLFMPNHEFFIHGTMKFNRPLPTWFCGTLCSRRRYRGDVSREKEQISRSNSLTGWLTWSILFAIWDGCHLKYRFILHQLPAQTPHLHKMNFQVGINQKQPFLSKRDLSFLLR